MGIELQYSDDFLRGVFARTESIAVVGASLNPVKASYMVSKYLIKKGYRVYLVNPRAAGACLLGVPILATLREASEIPDMVDIFRNSEAAAAITDEAIALGVKTIWMQIGVQHADAAVRAEAAGLTVVMNRCPKIELGRLNGEIQWNGFASGILSSKRPRPGFAR